MAEGFTPTQPDRPTLRKTAICPKCQKEIVYYFDEKSIGQVGCITCKECEKSIDVILDEKEGTDLVQIEETVPEEPPEL